MAMTWQAGGIILALAGIGALHLSWKRKERSWPLVASGWLLLAASIVSWAQSSGADKGIALGLVVAVLIALGFVGAAALSGPTKLRRAAPVRSLPASIQASVWHEGLRAGFAMVAMVLAALVVSIATCTALFTAARSAGVEHTANLTVSMFAFPLALAAFTTFLAYCEDARLKAAWTAVPTALSAVIIAATFGAG
jgi:hypothetical protein